MGKITDKNDFWLIENNPITKVGVFPYLGKQISASCEPNKIYWVLRPKEELFKQKTLDSLKLLPLVNEHEMLGKDCTPAEEKGIEGTLGQNVSHNDDTIFNDIKIFSEDMKDKIKGGKKELSLGYWCDYEKQSGTYNGQRYDYIQKNIIGNHLALVDKGRMGSDVRVYDSAIEIGKTFAMDSVAIDDDKKTEWITVKGNHIPIKEGESKGEAVKKFIESKKGGEGKKHKSGLNSEKVKRFRELLNKKDTEAIEKEFGKKIWGDNKEIDFLKSSLWLKYDKNSKDPNLPDFEYLKDDKAENRSGYEESGEDSIDIEKGKYKNITEEKKEMAEEKKQVEAKDEDKRKLIDEIGGMLKDKVSEEEWKTIIGKAEKIAYNPSEEGKGTDEDEDKDKDTKKKEEGKDGEEDKDKATKDKCGKDGEEDKDKDKKDGEDEDKDKDKEKKGMDADFVKEFADKERFGKKVEEVVGTFDHLEMSKKDIAKYACDKLGIEAKDGNEVALVEGYIQGCKKAKNEATMKKVEDKSIDGVEDASLQRYLDNAEK